MFLYHFIISVPTPCLSEDRKKKERKTGACSSFIFYLFFQRQRNVKTLALPLMKLFGSLRCAANSIMSRGRTNWLFFFSSFVRKLKCIVAVFIAWCFLLKFLLKFNFLLHVVFFCGFFLLYKIVTKLFFFIFCILLCAGWVAWVALCKSVTL